MIKNLALRNLRNTEHVQFMTDILDIVEPRELQCDAQVATLAAMVEQMNKLYANDPAAALTDELAALDDIRDDLLIGLVKLFDAHTYSPDADKRAAAKALSRSMEVYGTGIAQQGYDTESASITGIMSDWNVKPGLKAAVALLGAREWVSSLEKANNKFKAKYLQQNDDPAIDTTHDATKAKRNEANKAYCDLAERMDSFYTIHNLSGPWGEAIDRMNALIDRYNATLSGRQAAEVAEV